MNYNILNILQYKIKEKVARIETKGKFFSQDNKGLLATFRRGGSLSHSTANFTVFLKYLNRSGTRKKNSYTQKGSKGVGELNIL
ncbi:MAG TPA: hypothetical protein ENJ20_07160 [Bacteroidetes bacterium]|nr:hypothetical protein [Bacteroidota bacterium]